MFFYVTNAGSQALLALAFGMALFIYSRTTSVKIFRNPLVLCLAVFAPYIVLTALLQNNEQIEERRLVFIFILAFIIHVLARAIKRRNRERAWPKR